MTTAQIPDTAERLANGSIVFRHTGQEWSGLDAAREWLQANGYSVGSMQRDAPIGFVHGDCFVGKWRNLNKADREQLDGTITPRGGLFRYSDAIVVFRAKGDA